MTSLPAVYVLEPSSLTMVRLAKGAGVSVSGLLGGVGSVGLSTVAVLTRFPSREAAAWIVIYTLSLPDALPILAIDAVTVPVPPKATPSVRVQVAGTTSDTSGVADGRSSVTFAACASDGPVFDTVIV